ncbi:MAG: hypothetical protein DIZ80_01380 [endosymbiont of Galathealinum brachiosum]|uniref:Dockerin domain-containing protein n=1 Tax=endosymbiont of Galathealinum brachiosum TaxID=2200906 RepID=A0A370DMM4_9GAMM|nr:MAG: hypothetical protein DIZ80_01380 [endosymbiont of Galathealinum brachiosum]
MEKVLQAIIVLILVLLTSGVTIAGKLHSATDTDSITLRALEAFHGSDRSGKDGVMRKAGYDLSLIVSEYKDYSNRGGFKKLKKHFKPSVELAKIHNEKIVVDIVASADTDKLVKQLKKRGMENISVYGRIISGSIPIDSLEPISGFTNLRSVKAAYSRTMSGSVDSQGDIAEYSDVARSMFSVNGNGVTIGTISDSFNCLGGAAADVSSGDLPQNINILLEDASCSSVTDEGRAMMQIIHDISPAASQTFYSATGGMASVANGILDLEQNANADIINDDIIYFAEPMFQDGVIAQAIDTVKSRGVSYFSAAGNNYRRSYESIYRNSGVRGYSSRSKRHDFDSGTSTDSLMQVTIPANTQIVFVLQWDDPFFSISGAPGADTDMDMILYSASGQVLGGSIDRNTGGDAVEVFAYTNTSSDAVIYQIAIDKVSGPDPGLIKFVYFGGMTINEYATSSASSYGHSNANGSHSVGAARYSKTPAYGVTPPLVEGFSSRGGLSVLFDLAGNSINELRLKPDIVAPNGVDNTFFGSDYDGNGFPNFFGTSAAVPHAAGVAALIKSFSYQLTPDEIYTIMDTTAIDMGSNGFDFTSGYGLINTVAALTSMDLDLDTVLNEVDNCPNDENLNQENNDLDSQGDVCDSDDDNDGISDTDEIAWGLNVFVSDTDNDGLTDYEEVCFDGDCLSYNPFPSGLDADANNNDTDGDGVLDGNEVALGTNLLVIEPAAQISDVGGVVNQGETVIITGANFCIEQCGNVSTNTETTVMLGCQSIELSSITPGSFEFIVPLDAITANIKVITPFGTSTDALINVSGTFQVGDINVDGELNAPDLLLMQKFILNISTPSVSQSHQADIYPPCSADGLIDASDLFLLQKQSLTQ